MGNRHSPAAAAASSSPLLERLTRLSLAPKRRLSRGGGADLQQQADHHHHHRSSSTQRFHICVLESLLSNEEGQLSVLQCLAKQREDVHLVHFISAVNEYEELFHNGEDSYMESLAEKEKFVARIVDLYLLNKKNGEYRTSKLREEIIECILDGEFAYLFIARDDALLALLENALVQRLVSSGGGQENHHQHRSTSTSNGQKQPPRRRQHGSNSRWRRATATASSQQVVRDAGVVFAAAENEPPHVC